MPYATRNASPAPLVLYLTAAFVDSGLKTTDPIEHKFHCLAFWAEEMGFVGTGKELGRNWGEAKHFSHLFLIESKSLCSQYDDDFNASAIQA